MKVWTPARQALRDSSSSSTEPIPTPCIDSSTRSDTSLLPAGPGTALATPTAAPCRRATTDVVVVPGSQMRSMYVVADARLIEKKRR